MTAPALPGTAPMATPLASRRCRALDGHAPLSPPQVQALLVQVDGWAVVDGAIEKRFAFADYQQTMAVLNATVGAGMVTQ